MSKCTRALIAQIGLALVLIVAGAPDVRAQSYISPLLGFDFGGDSGCPTITGCEDKHANYGVGLGKLGLVLGFETEFGYAKDFLGTAPGLESSVLTVMGNVLLVPAIGPVRPYGLVGVGLIRSNVEFTPAGLLSNDNSDLGWDVGGGVFIFFSDHVGVRGDIRHFHTFQDVAFGPLVLGENKLDFGRASGALVFKF